jgi:hypothetical protein
MFSLVNLVMGQESDTTEQNKRYTVHIQNYSTVFTLFLGRCTPTDDSCSLLKVSCGMLQGAEFHFRYLQNRTWIYEGLITDTLVPENRFSLWGIQNESGNFSELTISIFNNGDSLLHLPIDITQNQDVRILSDIQPLAFPVSIGQYNFVCEERVIRGKTVIREYTNPAGYMRRFPELNYPELNMFHCGKGVKQPSYVYLKDIEGLMYYHILHYNNNAKYE